MTAGIHPVMKCISAGACNLQLALGSIDSLQHRSIFLKRVEDFCYSATTQLEFTADNPKEEAGLILYRTVNGYYILVKTEDGVRLIKKDKGIRELVASAAYKYKTIVLRVNVDSAEVSFGYGHDADNLTPLGRPQSIAAITDNQLNRFNGAGIGIYASSNGKKETRQARFEWFEYNKK